MSMMRKWLWVGVACFGLLVVAAAWGQSPESAQKQLERMNVKYNEASFVKRAAEGDVLAVKLFI